MTDDTLRHRLSMGHHPAELYRPALVVVHGGAPQIGALLNRMGKESRFVGGMRVT